MASQLGTYVRKYTDLNLCVDGLQLKICQDFAWNK